MNARDLKCLGTGLFALSGTYRCFMAPLGSGPQVESFVSSADGTVQPYGLYVPRNYDRRKKYPVVVMLHGAGDNERLSLRRVFGRDNLPGESDSEASRWLPGWRDAKCLVVTPYARGTKGYGGIQEQDVLDALTEVKRRFSVDAGRAYLTGLSMGGGGALRIGLRHPGLWRALAAVCPAVVAEEIHGASNARGMPIHIYQGGEDPIVPLAATRRTASWLRRNGAHITYTEYKGVGHNAWSIAYRNERVLRNCFTIASSE